MSEMTISSRQFNQDIVSATKAAGDGAVIITEDGRPSRVLLSFDEYKKLQAAPRSIAEALAMPGGEDIDFDPQPSRELPRAANFD
jgi:prevent-host-death family protein